MGIGLGGFQGGGQAVSLAAGATGVDLTLSSTLAVTGAETVAKITTTNASGTVIDASSSLTSASAIQLSNGSGVNFSLADSDAYLTRTAANVVRLGGGAIGQFTAFQFNAVGNITIGGNLALSATAPTISAGAGAAIVAGTSTAFSAGLGAAAQTGTITFPSSTNGWIVQITNITNNSLYVISQTGGNATTATFTCYSRTTGLAANWTASDVIRCTAVAF